MRIPLSSLRKFPIPNLEKFLHLLGLEIESKERFDIPVKDPILCKVLNAKDKALLYDGSNHHIVEGYQLTIGEIVAYSKGKLFTMEELGFTGKMLFQAEENAKLGISLDEYLSDEIIDLYIPPNLGHLRSIWGITRECYGYIDKTMDISTPSLLCDSDSSVNIGDISEDCHEYSCRVIEDVTIKPSPPWLIILLKKYGYESNNNVVDITNLVMHELGHPIHAFDKDKISGKIGIREATHNEEIKTLDGTDRILPKGSLLVCDDKKSIALAGIMGGYNSKIDIETKNILIESAHFSPKAIRGASRSTHSITESSLRFENGIDPKMIEVALTTSSEKIKNLSNGKVSKKISRKYNKPYKTKFLKISRSKINNLLGKKIPGKDFKSILQKSHLYKENDGDIYHIKIPSWRNDIKMDVDIAKDILKIVGFDSSPKKHTIGHSRAYNFINHIKMIMVRLGCREFKTNSLSKHGKIKLLHTKNKDLSHMRDSLLPGLLNSLLYNLFKQSEDIYAFEVGKIYDIVNGKYIEKEMLGVIIKGRESPCHFSRKESEGDFLTLKGIFEDLFHLLQIKIEFTKASPSKHFHNSKFATICINEKIGEFGEILIRDLPRGIYYGEIDLLHLNKKSYKYTPIDRHPQSTRDLTLTRKLETPIGEIMKTIDMIKPKILKECQLLDIFYDGDKKNITLRMIYKGEKKTLTNKEVNEEQTKIEDLLTKHH